MVLGSVNSAYGVGLRVASAVLIHLGTSVAANAGELLTEAVWSAEIPKVVYATRQEQSVTNAPSSVTVINRQMIDALGVVNLAEIMHLVPGFQVFHSNGMTFGVTPHGFSDRYPKRLEVRVNGRSVYLPQLSSVAWESIGVLPDDIDHIEVVRGSNVPSYGSNAIMGAINIVTRSPVQENGGSIRATGGSIGTEILNLRQHLTLDSTDILLRAAHTESNGFKGFDDSGRIQHAVLNTVYTPGIADTLELEIGESSGEIGIGDTDHPEEFRDDHRRAVWVNSTWQHEAGNQVWKLHFDYTDYSFDHSYEVLLSDLFSAELGAPVAPELVPLLTEGRQDQLIQLYEGERDFAVGNLELEHHFTGDNWRTVWGIGVRQDMLNNQEFVGGKVDSWMHYAFTNLEMSLSPRLDLNVGLMLEHRDGFDNDLSPRAALNYHFDENLHFRLSATRAYRQPSLLESDLQWTLRMNDGYLLDLVETSGDNVHSEQVDSYEFGVISYWLDGDLGLNLKFFREEVTGEIDSFDVKVENCTNPNPEQAPIAAEYCPDFYVDGQYGARFEDRVRVFTNVVDWEVQGFEAEATYRFNRSSWLRFNYAFLTSDGVWLRRLHDTPYYFPLKGQDLAPRYTTGLLYSQELNANWKFSGFLRYMDYVNWRSGTDVEDYSRLDLKLARNWNLPGGELEMALTLQNALDDKYIEFQRNNAFERRVLLSVTYQWAE